MPHVLNAAQVESIPFAEGVEVLQWHACGLLAVHKPEGLMCHPNEGKAISRRALVGALYDSKRECYLLKENPECKLDELFLLHRVDGPTSGVLLLATDEEVARRARDQFMRRRVAKRYAAVVIGKPPTLPNVWVDHLVRRRQGSKVRVGAGEDLKAKTHMRLIKSDPNGVGLALLSLEPLTGRTHQLRVQCALRGYPILGDRTYGKFSVNRRLAKAIETRRMFLHAACVELEISVDGKPVAFSATSPVPDIFEKLVAPWAALRNLRYQAVVATGRPSGGSGLRRRNRRMRPKR